MVSVYSYPCFVQGHRETAVILLRCPGPVESVYRAGLLFVSAVGMLCFLGISRFSVRVNVSHVGTFKVVHERGIHSCP